MEGRNRSSESCVIGIPAESCVIGIPADKFMREQQPPPRPRPDHASGRIPVNVHREEEEEKEEYGPVACGIIGVCCCIGAIAFITVLVKTVLYTVLGGEKYRPKFGLNFLSVSNLNISGSEISGIWDVEFLAKSRDFLHTNNYPQPTLSVYYQNQLLLEEILPLPAIHIPKKSTISYKVNALAMATSIQNKRVADAIAKEWSQQRVVPFTVTLLATPSLDNWNQFIVNVTCAGIKVGFSSSSQGTMLQESSANNNNTHRQAFTRCSNGYYCYYLLNSSP